MGFGRYRATIMLITFIVTKSEQRQELQNISTNPLTFFSNVQLSDQIAKRFKRDTHTKWKLNRLVSFRAKYEKPNIDTISDFSSNMQTTTANKIMDSNYWKKQNNLLSKQGVEKIKPNIINLKSTKYLNPISSTVKSNSDRVKSFKLSDFIKLYTNDSLKPHQIRRKRLMNFWEMYNEFVKSNITGIKPFVSSKNNPTCVENKITKILYANYVTMNPNEEQTSLSSIKEDLKTKTKDFFSDFYYWYKDETHDMKKITTQSISTNFKEETPTTFPTTQTSLPDKINSTLDYIESSTSIPYTINVTSDENTDTTFDWNDHINNKTNKDELLIAEHTQAVIINITFNTSPKQITSPTDSISLEKDQKYEVQEDLTQNEIKFNKRSLKNIETGQTKHPSGNDKIKFFEMYDSHTHDIVEEYNILNNINIPSPQSMKKTANLESNLQNREENLNKFEQQEEIMPKLTLLNVTDPQNNCSCPDGDISTTTKTTTVITKKNDIITTAKDEIIIKTENSKSSDEKRRGTSETAPDTTPTGTETETDTMPSTNIFDHVTKKPLRSRDKRGSTRHIFNISTKKHVPKSDLLLHRSLKTSWTLYPFAAAYIHEPLQIHCDAAGISAHWLITSAACMSRMYTNKDDFEGRSAYVSYCSNEWWRPELVAYVKYSIIHPQYNHRDKLKRRLYNIGLIRVADSMAATCAKWKPVPLMYHQIINKLDGAEAVAIGFGLDRKTVDQLNSAQSRYKPLSMYTGQVFSDSCPGNLKYGKPKSVEEELSLKNVYCLSLPPYQGEENDPTHGSILMLRNRFIGLYLQEERRVFGDQSAMYTGIWKLLPWVFETAKEPENVESFSLDIL